MIFLIFVAIMKLKILLFSILTIVSPIVAGATDTPETPDIKPLTLDATSEGLPVVSNDSIQLISGNEEITVDSIAPQKLNIVQKVINYFNNTNKPKSEKKLDFSFIGGPAYANDTKLSVGILGAALYKSIPFDSLTPQSNATLYSEFSITGFYLVGIKGDHIGPKDNYRVNYKVYFESFPNKFWGIGYDDGRNDANETKYLQLSASLHASFQWRLARGLYLGPSVDFSYVKASRADDYVLWRGEDLRTLNYGLGFDLSYDTRDVITNSYSGVYVLFQQRFYPRFLKNHYAFSSSEFTFNYYHKAWKGAVFAGQVHGTITYGNTPWSQLPSLGGSRCMRGYYEGRYRDKCEADITLELRQHIYRRSSAVAWIGAGSIAPKPSEFTMRHLLPNFGVGYRWEFKKRMNVRLDVGFGKGERGFVFNINEAF